MNEIILINGILCTIFCTIYVGALIASNLFVNKKLFKTNTNIKDLSLKSAIFGLVMSIPFLPFIYGFSVINEFSSTIITLFFLANIFWQTIYIRLQAKEAFENFLVGISLSNLIAWSFMIISNTMLYYPIGKIIARFF